MGPSVDSSQLNALSTASRPSIKKTSALSEWILRLLTFILAIFALNVPAMGASHKNVLVLHEGSRLLPYQVLMAHELQKDLTSSASTGIEVFEEYLDNWRLDQDMTQSANALDAKYSGRKFEAVLADGTGAFDLLLNSPPDFLRGTPVVFVSVPDFHLPPKLPPNITGVTTHVDYAATVRLAKTIQPNLQHIYYIEGEPLTNEAKNKALEEEFRPFQNHLDIVFWKHDDVSTLVKKVSNLPRHSAVLFDSYFVDPSGQTYVPAEIGAEIAENANAPMYTLYQTMVGVGPVGGVVVNFEAIGRRAANIILLLLSGAKVSDFPVERSHNNTMIDWRQFERFHLPEGRLPSSAIVLYREPSIWIRYYWYFLAGGLVIFLQMLLIFKLAIAAKKRKESENSTRKLAGRLIHAQEEERRRIARELHDDLSQRLALVCIQLDTLRMAPPGSREMLIQELSILYDETDLISSDIHQFSRELHPAILEKLGLIPALRRYCSEFSQRRKIAVDMKVSGEEAFLPQEAALALFRVGQECLVNVAKHSGAVSCVVHLNYARDRATLEVSDNGCGFESQELGKTAGLGIESMRERLRSTEGTLVVNTTPAQGTKVRAEVPISRTEPESEQTDFNETVKVHPSVPAS